MRICRWDPSPALQYQCHSHVYPARGLSASEEPSSFKNFSGKVPISFSKPLLQQQNYSEYNHRFTFQTLTIWFWIFKTLFNSLIQLQVTGFWGPCFLLDGHSKRGHTQLDNNIRWVTDHFIAPTALPYLLIHLSLCQSWPPLYTLKYW